MTSFVPQAVVDETAEALAGFLDRAGSLEETMDSRPQPGSRAEAEIAEFEAADYTYAVAGILRGSSDDYLNGLAGLLQQPVPRFSILALSRSALENASRAWWLLDPGIDARQRAARGFQERLYSLREALAVEQVLYAGDPEAPTSDRSMEAVANEAEDLGFTVVRSRSGIRLDIETRPTSTELLEQIHGDWGRVLYKYLSASVHGTTYAVRGRYTTVEGQERGTRQIIEPSTDFSWESLAMGTAALTQAAAMDRQILLYGWPHTEWAAWRTDALEKIWALAIRCSPKLRD